MESIQQFCTNFEIIIVDNASSEGKINEYLRDFKTIKFILNEKNVGFAAANNQGAKIASGEYLVILNNDTIFLENSLEVLKKFIIKQNEELIVGCKLLNEDKSLQESVVNFPNVWNLFTENYFLYRLFPKSKIFNKYSLSYFEGENPIVVDVVKGAFMFLKKTTWRKLGGFDEKFFFYSEETDLCYRLRNKLGGKVFYLPSTSIIHLGGVTADKNLKFKFYNQAKAKIQFFQKHFGGVNFIVALFLHYSGLAFRVFVYLIPGILLLKKKQILKSYYFLMQIFIYPKNVFK